MAGIGSAIVWINGNTSGLNKALGDAERATRQSIGNITAAAAKIGTGMTLMGGGILGIIGKMTQMSMNAVESENLFSVSMGKMEESARKWSEEVSKSLGLNAYEVRKNIGTFNAMLKGMGQTEQAAFNMSKGLTQLAYDMASFYNLKPEEAFEKLKSGISGETEPLKSLGVLISDDAVKAYALAHGIGTVTGITAENARQMQIATLTYQQQSATIANSKKSVEEKRLAMEKLNLQYQGTIERLGSQKMQLDDNSKVMARYGLIMEKTSLAQGDMARTIDSPANQLRIMNARVQQLSTDIGTKLIPVLEKTLPPISEFVTKISDWVKLHPEATGGIAKAALAFGALNFTVGPLLILLPKAIDFLKTVGTVSKYVAVEGIGKLIGAAGAGGLAGLGSLLIGGLAIGGTIAGVAALAETFYKLSRGMNDCGNFITRFIDNNLKPLGDRIDQIFDKLLGLQGKFASFTTALSLVTPGGGAISMPGFANGGVMQRGGLAVVGERGPELVSLPIGARVFNNRESQALASAAAAGGDGGPLIGSLTVNWQSPNRPTAQEAKEILTTALREVRRGRG